MSRYLTPIVAAILLLAACENVDVTWAPTELQAEAEASADCHFGVEPQPRGTVVFRLIDCDPRTVGEVFLGNGDALYLSGPTRQVWSPNPRRVQHQYSVRGRLIEGQRFSPNSPRVFIGNLHYRW